MAFLYFFMKLGQGADLELRLRLIVPESLPAIRDYHRRKGPR
jgi:hypothetical protein